MAEGITLKRIIDMDEAAELSSSDYALVDSATGGPKKFALGNELSSLKEDLSGPTKNINTSPMGRWNNAADGKIYNRDEDTYYGMKDFIPVVEGSPYAIRFFGVPSTAIWTYLFVDDSGNVISRAGYQDALPRIVTVPTGSTKLNVFCKADSTISITDETHLQIELGDRATSYIPPISAVDYVVREKAEKGFYIYALIDNSYDLDLITQPGAYRYNTASVPLNAPVQFASRLINMPSDADNGTGSLQIVVVANTKQYLRYKTSSGWGEWVAVADTVYVEERLLELETKLLINEGETWEV